MREIKLAKTEMGLPNAMVDSFSGVVKVVKPDPNIINPLPNLSQESFYCNLEVGQVTKIDFQGIPYTFTQKTTGVEVSPPIQNKSLYLTDETVSFNNARIIIGSTGVAENNAPVISSTPPNLNINIEDTFTYTIIAADSNGDTITITAPILPDWLTFTDNGDGTALLTGTAYVNDAGVNNVSIVATDGGLDSVQNFDIFVDLPDLLIWEIVDTNSQWGIIPGKSYAYDRGAKYILLKNNEPNVTVELEYYKLAFTSSELVISDQPNDGGLTWISGTGDFANYEYAINTSQLTQIQHESAANALGANLASVTNATENTFILNTILSGNSGAWIGYYSPSGVTDFSWFDNNSSTYFNWSSNEPDSNTNAVGAILGFLGSSEWVDELQTQQNSGVYKRLINVESMVFNNNSTKEYIPLSGNLGPGKYLLITRDDADDDIPSPGDNFIGAFADPSLTDVLHQEFHYTNNWKSRNYYSGFAFNGNESVELIVNNGNSSDYVVDRLGLTPTDGTVNTFIWTNQSVKRTGNFVPTQNFNPSDWTKYDIINNQSLLTQTPSIFTYLTLVPNTPQKVNGYYPLYNTEIFAASPINTLTTYTFNGIDYYMPNGLVINETYFLGTYDDPIDVNGYYPLYHNSEIAVIKSPTNTFHTHEFSGITYYMPDGLIENSTYFHGNYDNAFFLEDYYPLFRTEFGANSHTAGPGKYDVPSGNGTSREIVLNNKTYYMPNGLIYLGNSTHYYTKWFDEVLFLNDHYPLYRAEIYAIAKSPVSSATKFSGAAFGNNDYWMPDGLVEGETMFVGTYSTPLVIPCLTKDSKVKTPNGYVSVTKIKKYDIVITSDGRKVPVTRVNKNIITTNRVNAPYIIPKHFFGKNYPRKEFEISPSHAIAINSTANEWFIPYIHGKNLKRHKNYDEITYYHIELPNWLTDHLVINNGVVVESYGDSYHKKLKLENILYKKNNNGYYLRDYNMYMLSKSVLLKIN